MSNTNGGSDMSFQAFKPQKTQLNEYISLGSRQVNFGKNKPPHEYLSIEYDIENLCIRFIPATKGTGSKVFHIDNRSKKSRSDYHYYTMNATAFLKLGLLPKGRYEPVGDATELIFRKQV